MNSEVPNEENVEEPVVENTTQAEATPAEAATTEPATEESAGSTEPETADSSTGTEEVPAAEAKPRVQLNPTGTTGFRAVGTRETAAPPTVDLSADAGAEAAGAVEAPSAQVVPDAAPVEIPDAGDLDAQMEAEIAAAMSSDDAALISTPVVEATEEGAVPPQAGSEEELEDGARLKGTVQSVDGENVFLDLGYRSPGVVQVRQYQEGKVPAVGAEVTVVLDKYSADEGLLLCRVAGGAAKPSGNWDELENGQVVDVMVSKTNKGGLEINVANIRGFMPAGQVDLRYVDNLEPYVGQKLRCVVTEVNPQKRNLIVSRRAFLEQERAEVAGNLWQVIDVGQQYTGTVKTLKNYGAFVDIGGIDGFLHIGEISWQRLNHPSEVLGEGQQVEVKVISVDREKNRVGLGMKQMSQSPWESAAENFAIGSIVSGTVTRTTDFGAFVELEPGVEGLVHISELEYRRVNKVTDVVSVGQQVDVKVLEVDLSKNRISLSVKQTQERPASKSKEPKVADEDLAPGGGEAYVRKRKEPLKGGTGSAGGGLFGNPEDFS